MSPSRQAIKNAQLVLAKCSSNDPWFPQPSDAVILAWAEHFQIKNYELPDLLAAVTNAYATHGSGFKPLPGDILSAAAAIRNDRSMRESDVERERRQEERDRRIELKQLVEAQEFSPPKPKFQRSTGLNALVISCPWCNQAKGSPCVIPGSFDRTKAPHDLRVRAAKEFVG